MQYLSVTAARQRSGLRLVLTEGMPGPWAEAVKSLFAYKHIEYIPVVQRAGESNTELKGWTGQTSAPVAVLNAEPACCTWLDQLLLAERLNPELALLPADLEQRALVVGLSREIAGERGLGWNRRLHMLAPMILAEKTPEGVQRMADKYGWSEAEFEASEARIIECLDYFTVRLRTQARLQSEYLVGSSLTAVDFYLANFMGIFRPLPEALNPMPDILRKLYSQKIPALEGALNPELFQHRDMMYQKHIATPLQF